MGAALKGKTEAWLRTSGSAHDANQESGIRPLVVLQDLDCGCPTRNMGQSPRMGIDGITQVRISPRIIPTPTPTPFPPISAWGTWMGARRQDMVTTLKAV
jgi:hypothetical protein